MAADKVDDLFLAASLYYGQGQTMEAVARRLMTSRSTVSRLLKAAREQGIVSITVNDPSRGVQGAARKIQDVFSVAVSVVPLPADTTESERLKLVAAEGARILESLVDSSMILAVAWGNTTAAIAQEIRSRGARHGGGVIVQLNGAANTRTSGVSYTAALLSRFARAFGASVLDFPVPTFFDSATTKELMWRERSITRVLKVQAKADVAVMSVGTLDGPLPSHVYTAGYLDSADMRTLRREAVAGDVCTVFLREDGTYADIEMNKRASGPTPEQLGLIGRRLLVVAGDAKVDGLLGALRAGVATDLVVDERTASLLAHRL
ncbi:MAG: transcriptional regulator [Bifidobacteriaceae bacterium]|jgi:DNA-binding transcriptional regulator LsrR (DeoR family)|nr:transcriptional regulator [Bifidobacteriaceae bacterium]